MNKIGAIYVGRRVCNWGRFDVHLTAKRLVLDWSAHPQQPGVKVLENFMNRIKADGTVEARRWLDDAGNLTGMCFTILLIK